MQLVLIFIFSFSFLFLFPFSSPHCTSISSYYAVTQSFEVDNPSSPCFVISANNVVVEGNGLTITCGSGCNGNQTAFQSSFSYPYLFTYLFIYIFIYL